MTFMWVMNLMIIHRFSNNAMKTIKNFMLVAFAATSIIACQKEEANQNDIAPKGEVVTFTGSVNSTETKTAIHYADGAAEFPTLFTSSDVIAVNGVKSKANILNDETGQYEYKEGVAVGKDQTSITFDVEGVTAPYYAVTGTHYKQNYADGVYPIQVSGTGAMQKFRTVAGGEYVSFHSSSDILAAYSETESFEFKHMSTFYAITIDSENSTIKDKIKNIYIRQGDGSNIAGQWTLKFDENHNSFLEPSNLTAFIGYDCGEGGVAQSTTMIVGLPSYNYENGLIFTIKDVNGKFASYKVPAAKTMHAADGGKIIPFKPKFNPGDGVINSAADWNEFAAFVNNTKEKKDWEIYRWIGAGGNTIKLGKNIEAEDLDPITVDFTYTLDGNGKTITRTNATSALFTKVSGEVKNLTLAGTLNLTDEGAPLVNTLAKGGKITGCTNNMTVTFEAADHAYVGGLVKIMQGGTIEGCVNEGVINVNVDASKANRNVAVGGIVSQINAGTEAATLKDCINRAAVTLTPKSATDASTGMPVCALGGVAGWLRAAKSFNFTNCDNSGAVTLSAAELQSKNGFAAYAMCVGGVIGTGAAINTGSGIIYAPDSENATFVIVLNGCDNTGVISNQGVNYSGESDTTIKAGNKKVFTGGLAGSLLGTSSNYVSLTSCSNTGDIYTYNLTGDTSSAQSGYCSVVGGFVGLGGYLNMDKCTVNCNINNGEGIAVRPTVSIAGVIGFTLRPFSLSNSNIYYSGYFQRLNHFKMNRAVVAVVPAKYLGETGSTASNMAMTPNVAGSTITNCNIGGYVLSGTQLSSDDKSDNKGSLTTPLFNSSSKTNSNLVCGQGFTANTGVTVTDYTYWEGK